MKVQHLEYYRSKGINFKNMIIEYREIEKKKIRQKLGTNNRLKSSDLDSVTKVSLSSFKVVMKFIDQM